MSSRTVLAIVTLAFFLLAPVSFGQATSSVPAKSVSLKDKIVFVHMDPSVGVISLHSITDVNGATGEVTGAHDAPDMASMSSSNHAKDEIELMNPDGSSITSLHAFGSDPMLSPDGTKIVYCSIRQSIYSQIYVMNSDGTNNKRLTDIKTGDACGPAWSPDGKKIAYYAFALTQPSRNPEIWLMDPDGSNAKKLIDHGIDPSWSPDGRQIVFASHRDGIFQIYAMNSEGSNVRRLTKHNAEDSNPAWAPDGNSIIYSSATKDDHRGLFLMGADGSEPHAIGHSKNQDFCFPSWSSDGRTVVFTVLNRLGSQGIVTGEEKPRCEQWSGDYQIFSMGEEGNVKLLAGSKVMGSRPSYGKIATTP
jgi:Tol biopolymer transport system component